MSDPIDPRLRNLALACLALLSACANVWVDAEGNRHVVGLVHLTLPPSQAPAAVETLRVRTFGLSWTYSEVGSAILLGYGDSTLGFLRNDVCVAPDATRLESSQ